MLYIIVYSEKNIHIIDNRFSMTKKTIYYSMALVFLHQNHHLPYNVKTADYILIIPNTGQRILLIQTNIASLVLMTTTRYKCYTIIQNMQYNIRYSFQCLVLGYYQYISSLLYLRYAQKLQCLNVLLNTNVGLNY